MAEKYKRLRDVTAIAVFISFTFLSFLVGRSSANENANKGNSYPEIKQKIDTVELQIAKERYRLRMKDAREYLDRGDRYYAQGKLPEALGEWYAAQALLDVLQGVNIQPTSEACARLEEEIKTRISAEKNKADSRRQAQVDKRVREALRQEVIKEKTAEKERALASSVEPEKKSQEAVPERGKEVVAKKEDKVSLQDLEIMKKNRQAVEQMISQELVKDRESMRSAEIIAPPAKAPELIKEDVGLQKAIEAQIAQEVDSRKKTEEPRPKVVKQAGPDKRQIEKQKRLEAKKILAQEEERLRQEKIAKENEDLRWAAEESTLKGKAQAKKEAAKSKEGVERKEKEALAKQKQEAKADEQFKKQAEEAIRDQLAQEVKKNQALKTKTEIKEGERLKSLIQDEAKLKVVDSQLKTLEESNKAADARKKIVKKEKKAAPKRPAKEAKKPAIPAENKVDKFDIIDRILGSYDDKYID